MAGNPPAAIVIDLVSMPSYGRVMGALLRERKSTRMIPLVFVEGDPEKARRTREMLPDAVFTGLLKIGPALRRAIQEPPQEPVAPVPSGVTLLQKLRIREGSVVGLLHAPRGFETKLDPLPDGARVQSSIQKADVILVFVKSAAGLGRELPALARECRKGLAMWVVWPKKTSSMASGLTMPLIREMCRQVGLIDYRICAVDETWSAMAVSRSARSRGSSDKKRRAARSPGSAAGRLEIEW